VVKNMTEVTAENFESEVLAAELPVLVDFWAEWCAPCKMIEPLLEELSEELAGELKFTRLDVDQYPNLAGQFGIMSIPTMGIFKNGELANLKGLNSRLGWRGIRGLTSVLGETPGCLR